MWSRACFRRRSPRRSARSAAIRCSCWSPVARPSRTLAQGGRGRPPGLADRRRDREALPGDFWPRRSEMLHGWIILDKPLGLGSTTAVSAVKRILREAGEPKTKVGHGGTLDPLASGVLPIALGEATKLAGRMLGATKAYDFTIRFGKETDTLDAEGESSRPAKSGRRSIRSRPYSRLHRRDRAGAARLFGAQDRREGGLRAGKSRRGRGVEAAPCHFTPSMISATPPTRRFGLAQLRGDVGTPLGHRLERHLHSQPCPRHRPALGTVGHVSYLRRTRAGPFALEQAISLDFLEEAAKARALRGRYCRYCGAGRHPGPPRHSRPGPAAPSWTAAVWVPRKAGASTGDPGGHSRRSGRSSGRRPEGRQGLQPLKRTGVI